MADCNEAVRLNPNLAEAYSLRGMVYMAGMDMTRARADFEKALQLNPNDSGARSGLHTLDTLKGMLRRE
jgi:Flp pilus assembly protein TadD